MAKTPAKKKVVKLKKQSPKVHWLAEGYTTVVPFLTLKKPFDAIAFYKKAFGFKEKYAVPGPDGTLMHAEMIHEGFAIMMGGESKEQKMFSPSYYKGTPLTLYLYTPDVDAVAKKAKKAGAICYQEPQDMYWGDRVAIFADPEGYVWLFATHVKEVAPEDMHP